MSQLLMIEKLLYIQLWHIQELLSLCRGWTREALERQIEEIQVEIEFCQRQIKELC